MQSTIDKTQPGEKWEFDEAVTAAFDDMLRRSIPQYDVMRKACFDIGCRYVQKETDIMDLGCSRGEALEPFVSKFGGFNSYVGVEVSEPMADAFKERFAFWIDKGRVRFENTDLRYGYPGSVQASVTLCVLTLQFTPIEYRQRILEDIYKATVPGGILILVEKVLGSTASLDRLQVDLYYENKQANGYSREDIDRKRFSLEGVLVPVTAKWNEELMQNAGFREIDCFWRWMNFAAWVAVKQP